MERTDSQAHCLPAMAASDWSSASIKAIALETGTLGRRSWRELHALRRSFLRWAAAAFLIGLAGIAYLSRESTVPRAISAVAIHTVWTIVWGFMVTVHLGLVRTAAGEHKGSLGVPNGLTVARIVLTPTLCWTVLAHDRLLAHAEIVAGVIFLVGFTDVLDGVLARLTGWETVLGRYLDHWADVLIMTCLATVEGIAGLIPLWLMAAIVIRYLVVGVGAIYGLATLPQIRISPAVTGKLTTAVAGMVLFLAVAQPLLFPAFTRYNLAVYIVCAGVVGANLAEMLVMGIRALRKSQVQEDPAR